MRRKEPNWKAIAEEAIASSPKILAALKRYEDEENDKKSMPQPKKPD